MVMRHALYLPLVVSLLLPGLQAIAAEEPRPEQVQSDISTREISIESNFTRHTTSQVTISQISESRAGSGRPSMAVP